LLWTPELLRGSQDVNRIANREEADECYNDRLTMELNEVLQTHGSPFNDTGYVWEWDMDQALDYIEDDLGCQVSSKTHWDSHETSVQQCYNYLSLHHRPVVIHTPGHFCVLERFIENRAEESLTMVIH
jgi:hypothetical protein